jgi:FMN reductase
MSITIISGSPSPSSRSARLLGFVQNELANAGHDVNILHLRDLPAQSLLRANYFDVVIGAAVSRVKTASAIVVGTPVYKAAYSGLLKAFLDLLPQDGFRGKVVLPIATAGSPSHGLALDYALRPVLQSMSPQQILPGVYATDRQVYWDDQVGLTLDADVERRLLESAADLSRLLLASEVAKPVSHEFEPVEFSAVRCST